MRVVAARGGHAHAPGGGQACMADTMPTAKPPTALAGSHRDQQPQAPAGEDIGATSHRLYTNIGLGGVGTASGRGEGQRMGPPPSLAAAPPKRAAYPGGRIARPAGVGVSGVGGGVSRGGSGRGGGGGGDHASGPKNRAPAATPVADQGSHAVGRGIVAAAAARGQELGAKRGTAWRGLESRWE